MATTDLSTRVIVQGLRTTVVGVNVTYVPSLESTQDEVAALDDDDPEGSVFITDEQTAGRGRHGRQWLAPPGTSLLLSVMLRPSAEVFPKLVMVASLALANAVEQVTGLHAEIKWPNDLLVNGKKAGGVLVEGAFFGEDPRYAAIGIGVNVNWDAMTIAGAPYPATSLSQELGQPISRNTLAIALLNELDRLYLAAQRGEPVREAWRAKVSTLGRHVRLMLDGIAVDGIAEDVDGDGALLVRSADGKLEAYYAAEVTLQEA